MLWKELRGRRFAGFKFRRQQVFGSHVLDFYCSNARLALEVDGETHLGKEKLDERRNLWLERQTIKVLRFWNSQIYDELESVLELVFRECECRRDQRFSDGDKDDRGE
ncbi:MAG: DUF559 domain-containing protein [Planctomycetes bacterium]|nr:DUF559 domain-containing protein [Planctomycetota bacterium]